MTLFGQTFDAQQIMGLVSMLLLLAFWIMVLGRERRYARWFSQWEADRKARRQAEIAGERGDQDQHRGPRGPWG